MCHAAWVFVKFRAPGSNDWEHAKLSASAGDHAAPGGVVEVGMDAAGTYGVGAFIHSAAARTGDVAYARTRLKWDYGSNGYSFAKGESVEVSVQAIEMVYVPQGSFYVGSGGTETFSLTDGSWGGSGGSIPFRITGSWDRQLTNAAGNLWAMGVNVGGIGVLNADYPTGFNAFYCMKYEVTQGQYRDFLNLLTRSQQKSRGSIAASQFTLSNKSGITARNGIRCPAVIPAEPEPVVFVCDGNANGTGDEADDGMDWACNYLTWAHALAYADWAGLRPMTELEFEKACRGPADPVPNEYAWGTATIVVQTGHTGGADGSGTEKALPANANCNGPDNKVGGPVRAGIYATADSTRQASGASYWGILELSGNPCEWTVTVGDAGRGFTGLHGDGVLSPAGAANAANWGGEFYRGGSFAGGYTSVSDRKNAAHASTSQNLVASGFRGVRTAP